MGHISTKGQTLKYLHGKLELFQIPKLITISHECWIKDFRMKLKIKNSFDRKTVIVRSSARDDTEFSAKLEHMHLCWTFLLMMKTN